jgi:hypothetical protein
LYLSNLGSRKFSSGIGCDHDPQLNGRLRRLLDFRKNNVANPYLVFDLQEGTFGGIVAVLHYSQERCSVTPAW